MFRASWYVEGRLAVMEVTQIRFSSVKPFCERWEPLERGPFRLPVPPTVNKADLRNFLSKGEVL